MAAWDGSFENVPDPNEDISLGASRTTALKTETRLRAQVETNHGSIAAGYNDDGRLNPGAARAFAQPAPGPTQLLRPDGAAAAQGPTGFAAALGAADNGRLWLDTTDDPNVPVLKWWTGTAWQPVQLAPTGDNIVSINGSMEVWQRGTAATAYTSTGVYLADRWVVYDVNAIDTALMSRASTPATSTATSQYSLKLKGAVGVGAVSVAQRIEAEYAPLYTGNISVSGHIFVDDDDDGTASGTTTITIRLRTPNNTTDNDFSGGTTERAFTAASGSLTNARFTFDGIDTSGYTNIQHGLEVQIQVATGALDSTAKAVYLTDLQIEKADTASAFRYRGRPVELPKCQRYYEKTFDHDDAPGTTNTRGALWVVGDGTNNQDANWQFKVSKVRDDYTLTIYNPDSGATGSGRNYAGTEDRSIAEETASGGQARGENGVGVGVAATTLAGQEVAFHAVANAEL